MDGGAGLNRLFVFLGGPYNSPQPSLSLSLSLARLPSSSGSKPDSLPSLLPPPFPQATIKLAGVSLSLRTIT